MNKYTYSFISKCPKNNDYVFYTLTIKSKKMILVEYIIKQCATYKEGYHEEIADDLYKYFSGSQKLTATHTGVQIETTRNENNA